MASTLEDRAAIDFHVHIEVGPDGDDHLSPELREAVARYFTRTRGVDVGPEDVVCACGGKPFIGYAIQTLTDYGEGHEVVFPNPGFPIYSSMATASASG